MSEMEKQLRKYANSKENSDLEKAIAYEVYYQYLEYKLENNCKDLCFEDIENITEEMLGSYCLNEMLCDTILEKIDNYIKE